MGIVRRIAFDARRWVPRPLRKFLGRLWARQFQFGVTPLDLPRLSQEFSFSAAGKKWDTAVAVGVGGWLPAANHSHGYHGLLRQWWTVYGLGSKCLLVSETRDVGASFAARYPDTRMVTTDYHLNLLAATAVTDVVWNLYEAAPPEIAETKYGSIICQATLEHLMDPVGVLGRLVALLEEDGHLYLHTHTPLYPYHAWPRDYLRYFPDWFVDIGMLIPGVKAIEVYCTGGHAFAAYKKVPALVAKDG